MVSDPRISYALPLLVAAWLVTVGSVAMYTACAEPVDGAKKLLVVDEPLGIAGYFSVVAAGLVAVVRYACGGNRRACFLAIAGLALLSSIAIGVLGVAWAWLGLFPVALCLAASADRFGWAAGTRSSPS